MTGPVAPPCTCIASWAYEDRPDGSVQGTREVGVVDPTCPEHGDA